jgi:hypothetical protein
MLADRHLVNRPLVDRHLVDRTLVETDLVDRYLVDRHLVDRHIVIRHLVDLTIVKNQPSDRKLVTMCRSNTCVCQMSFGEFVHPNVCRSISFRSKDAKPSKESVTPQGLIAFVGDVFSVGDDDCNMNGENDNESDDEKTESQQPFKLHFLLLFFAVQPHSPVVSRRLTKK